MACNLKTTKFLDCALIGVCAVNGSNTVCHVLAHISVEKHDKYLYFCLKNVTGYLFA